MPKSRPISTLECEPVFLSAIIWIGPPVRPVYGQPMQPTRPPVVAGNVHPPQPNLVRPHPTPNTASQPMISGQHVTSPPSANTLVSPMQNMNLEHQRPNVPVQVSISHA